MFCVCLCNVENHTENPSSYIIFFTVAFIYLFIQVQNIGFRNKLPNKLQKLHKACLQPPIDNKSGLFQSPKIHCSAAFVF